MLMKKTFKQIKNTISHIFFRYRYLWRRIGLSLITITLATIFGFILIKLMPGNVVEIYAQRLMNERRITYTEAYRLAVNMINYDPDLSVFQQLGNYLKGILSGDLGTSMYRSDINASVIIRDFLPWTLFISSIALFFSFVVGVFIGSNLAWKRNGIKEAAINGYIVISGSIPDYLWGLILIIFFGVRLGWFPIQGNYDILLEFNGLPFILNVLYHAFLPIMAFSIVQIGSWALSMRGSSIGVLGEDYIYAAMARGIPDKRIVSKHLRRNALLPLITMLALSFAALFGGAPLMENIFNYPGFGSEFSKALGMRDYFLVQGLMVFMSFVIILANLITDSLYSLIDPRVRRGS
jgi:peptide/nickel transport system permease protein